MALDKKNLVVRSFSGLVYIGLLIGCIILGPIAITILMALFAIIGAYELEANTVRTYNDSIWIITWTVDAAALFCMVFTAISHETRGIFLIILVLLIFFRFFLQIFISQQKPLQSIAVFTLELFYIGAPLTLLALLVAVIGEPWLIICALAMIWINDTGAYLVGCLTGRHKMFPRLSPKKSWEGFFGGLVFNIGAAFIFFYCFHLGENFPILTNVQGWIFIGICVTVFATLGDLFESMLKRSIGIKDFGNIIPGHGGILDRIDSLLFVVPCLLLFLLLASRMILV